MVLLAALFLATTQAFAISADPYFGMSPSDRSKYLQLALRSVVVVQAVDDSRRCSGTLISRNQVLTAAHCFDQIPGQPLPNFQILLMNSPQTIGRTIGVKKVHVHPLWLMGRKALADWNRDIEKLYAGLSRISQAAGPSCELRNMDWNTAFLSVYFKNLKQNAVTHRKSKDLCDSAIVKVHDLLARHAAVLDQEALLEGTTRPGDLAVVELEANIASNFHRPMAIDYDFEPAPGEDRLAFISGFGPTDESNLLAFPVNPLKVGFTDFRGMVGSDFMELAGSAVLCKGDSGGPTAYVKHEEMILVAVNAGTTGCNFRGNTSHALRVKAHADWLRSLIVPAK